MSELRIYDAMDVAAFIINYFNKNSIPINNLKLQKLLYLVQAHFVTETQNNRPLFKDNLELWAFGPVVPSVYYCLNDNNIQNIGYLESYNKICSFGVTIYNEDMIEVNDRIFIENILNKYSSYSTAQLIGVTKATAHLLDSDTLYKNKTDKTIEIDFIRRYFNNEVNL